MHLDAGGGHGDMSNDPQAQQGNPVGNEIDLTPSDSSAEMVGETTQTHVSDADQDLSPVPKGTDASSYSAEAVVVHHKPHRTPIQIFTEPKPEKPKGVGSYSMQTNVMHHNAMRGHMQFFSRLGQEKSKSPGEGKATITAEAEGLDAKNTGNKKGLNGSDRTPSAFSMSESATTAENRTAQAHAATVANVKQNSAKEIYMNKSDPTTDSENRRDYIEREGRNDYPEFYEGDRQQWFRDNLWKLLVILILIVLALLVIWWLFMHPAQQVTVKTVSYRAITGCSVINSSGSYRLTGNIKENTGKGSCIAITGNNVELNGSGYVIYENSTAANNKSVNYGIIVKYSDNVTIRNVAVEGFDYGVFLNNDTNSEIDNSDLRYNSVFGLYMINSKNDTVTESLLAAGAPRTIYTSNSTNSSKNTTVSNSSQSQVECMSTNQGIACFEWKYVNGQREFVQVPGPSNSS